MDLIFDAPWWLPTAIALAGIALFVAGNNRLDRTLRNVGAAVVLMGVLIFLLSVFIDTPKKIARRYSRQLIKDAVDGNWKDFQSLLEPDATLKILGMLSAYHTAADVTLAAKTGAQSVRLRDAHIRSLQVEQTGPLVTATLNILTEEDEPAAPVLNSSWQFEFENAKEGWRIRQINALAIGDLQPDQIEHALPKH